MGVDVAANPNLQRETVYAFSAVKPANSNSRRRRTVARVLSIPENSNKRRKYSMSDKERIYVKFLG